MEAVTDKTRVVIFAHYDKDCMIDNYVIHYLKELKKEADKIIFVSDCDINETETSKIKSLVSDCLAKRHSEYDFGSYKRGLEIFYEKYAAETDDLILCNDSCFGGLFPFKETFTKAAAAKPDFWGMSLVFENKPNLMHFQSFFLVLSKKIFEKEYFKKFFKNIKRLDNKGFVVSEYEIGLSKMLFEHTKNYYAAYSIGKLNEYLKENKHRIRKEMKEIYGKYTPFINFSKKSGSFFYDDWIYILLKMRCPLLKKVYQTMDIPASYSFYSTINKNSTFDIDIIKNYYERIGSKEKSILRTIFLNRKNKLIRSIEKLLCSLISSKDLRIRVRIFFERFENEQ